MNTMTASTMIANVAKQASTDVSSSLFTKSFLLDLLNDSLDYIYTSHNWSWNIVEETITPTTWSDAITLPTPAQDIFSVKDSDDNTYKQVTLPWWWDNEFKLDWDVLKFNKTLESDITVVYRRWNKKFDISNQWNYLDIPSGYNSILRWLMLTDILPLWLWEWGWWLMNNYFNRANDALIKKSKIDAYATPKKFHTNAVK